MEDYNKFFYDYLNEFNIDNDEDNSRVCLITKNPLEKYSITLRCGHSFNYIPLYNEIKVQKNIKQQNMNDRRLYTNQIKCPYCRTIHNNLIPYIDDIPETTQIYGVNYPKKYVLYGNTCKYIFKSGKRKNMVCGKDCLLEYCNSHKNCSNKVDVEGCSYVFKKGKSKGLKCNCKIYQNELCKKHFKD